MALGFLETTLKRLPCLCSGRGTVVHDDSQMQVLEVNVTDALLEPSAVFECASKVASNSAHMGCTCRKTSKSETGPTAYHKSAHTCHTDLNEKSGFYSNQGLFIHFKDEACLARLPSAP